MIKYNVIEGQGKVVAKIEGNKYDVLNVIQKSFGDLMVIGNPERYALKDVYKGVAKCHPEDVFSIEEGKDIAKARVLEKYNRDFTKKLMLFVDDMRELSTIADNMENSYIK